MAEIDLQSIFKSVTATLMESQSDLNQADSHNSDHGDNMVQIFEVITQAMKDKAGASPADQLAYASEILRKQTKSGSAKLYAQGLSQAAEQFQGQKLDSGNALQLIQSLLGAGQAPPPPESNPITSTLHQLARRRQPIRG